MADLHALYASYQLTSLSIESGLPLSKASGDSMAKNSAPLALRRPALSIYMPYLLTSEASSQL